MAPFFYCCFSDMIIRAFVSVGVPNLTLCENPACALRDVGSLQCEAAAQANSGARLFIGDVEGNGNQKLDDRCMHVKNQV